MGNENSIAPGLLRQVLRLAAPQWPALCGVLGLSLAAAALHAVEPLLLKHLFDALGATGARAVLVRTLLWLVAIALAHEAVGALRNWLVWRTRLQLHFRLLEAAVERLHRLPISYHQGAGVGATMTRLDRGIQGLLDACNQILFTALPSLVYLALAVHFMWQLDTRLALIVAAFAPVPALIASFAAPAQVERERRLLDRWAAIYSRFNEVLSGIAVVKSFTREDEERQRFLSAVSQANREVARGVGFDSGVNAARQLTTAAARLTALALGSYGLMRGEISLGTLIAFLGYVGAVFGPVQGLTGVYEMIRKASAAREALQAILGAPDTVSDRPGARELAAVRGRVSFERVQFAYPGSRRAVLRGIDLEVEAGERIAIVGQSGAGKSTLMALLQRFWDPTAGVVRIDGCDLREFRQRSLRGHIGVVLQEALLFNDTVHGNIAYGRPEASTADICTAARQAHAHEFIMRLPEGYQTSVGERGCRLSQGERQRIAIARALLKNPPLLILDEATSALDAESEALVQAALDELMQGRTSFVIAHRLATVVSADRIVVVKDGLIAETGTHRQLMAAGGQYAALVRLQTSGLLVAS
jgi:ATP-binding cassette subfamily B protein